MRERLESEGLVEGALLNGAPCTLGEGNTPLVRRSNRLETEKPSGPPR